MTLIEGVLVADLLGLEFAWMKDILFVQLS